jgi:hypothetical protein
MPVLTMKEVAPLDGRFFVDEVLPALRAAGFTSSLGLTLSDDDFRADGGEFFVETSLAGLESLLQGKAKTEEAPAWRRKKSGAPVLVVRAPKRVLQSLAALALTTEKKPSAAREIAAEKDAGVRSRKKRDRVRSHEGRLIKGVVRGSPPPPLDEAPAAAAPVAAGTAAATDRVEFAVNNLARFARAVLARVEDAPDDTVITFADGEVSRG